MQPLVPLRAPKLFNLRSDPFERSEQEAGDYVKWFVEHIFVLVPAQAIVGQFLATFQEFPPRQKPGSFSVDQALQKLIEPGRQQLAAASRHLKGSVHETAHSFFRYQPPPRSVRGSGDGCDIILRCRSHVEASGGPSSGQEAECRVHTRRQRRLRRLGYLRWRRACAALRHRTSTNWPARDCGFTQFLVEPACTPSRAALMTGQYSIRNGLSLIAIEGSPYTLSGARLHDGRAVQGRWLRHRNLRQVALRRRTAEPTDRAWVRRVLRHPAGH